MKIRNLEIVSLCLVIFSFFFALYFYPFLPEKVASHWNITGEVDGYTTRFWGAFILPIILTIVFALLAVIPRIDPKSKNIEIFRIYFDRFIFIFILFMFYLYALTIAWNLGYRFNLIKLLSPAFAMLFYYAGELVGHAEMNWTVGIRTPWTLSSPKVWEKTHKLGGKYFKIISLIALLGFFFPDYAIWFVLAPVIATSFFLFVYSYLEYKKI